MTLVAAAPPVTSSPGAEDVGPDDTSPAGIVPAPGGAPVGLRGSDRLDPRRVALLGGLCIVVLLLSTGVVLYSIGPLIHAREQRALIATERATIGDAAHDNEGLYRPALPTQPPVPGSALGILAIPALGLQQVVVEGVGPSQTVTGPGHVPGTAGLGQPGNSAIVGRRAGYGGPFGDLDQLRVGDHVVTATTEGQSLYVVRSVRTVTLTPTALYGPSSHNQLTLVTSAGDAPWNTDQAVVVVARLRGQPYTPTPQESRSPSQQGNTGDPDALAWLLLALLALAATLLGAVALYRRSTLRSAYLLTTAPLLAFTVLAAEAVSRLLPAWL